MYLNSPKILIIGIIFITIFLSVGATNYYVSLIGKNSNTGTSAETSWRTIAYAATKAQAGDVIYIQGGNYGHEHVVVSNSGTSSAPIVFQGYDGTPVLDGEDWLGYGIYVIGKQYITIKGLRVKNYRYGIWVSNESHYATIDGCVADSCCNTDYTTYGYDGYGFLVQDCDYSMIKNCSATDNGGDNIFLSRSNYCTIQNCQTYSKQIESNQFITDYYIVLAWSSHNVVRDCVCEDINGSYKGNHGFIIKDNPGSGGSEPHSTDNFIVNCKAKKFEEGFTFAHQAYSNTVDSCYADNTGKNSSFNFCFQNRDGAYGNTFSNCRSVGKTGIVSVYDGTEGSNPQTQDNTLFINCSFEGILSNTIGIFLRNATNTTFKNCNFVSIPYLFRFSKSMTGADVNSGTILKNCILSGITNQYDASSLASPWGFSGTETGYSDMENVTTTYTDFWNSFSALTGTGNMSDDPLFSDFANSDFHLKSQYGRWNGTTWINDALTSSCIDAGDPADNYSKEPTPNGNRINIGAYGNTVEASKSFGNFIPGPAGSIIGTQNICANQTGISYSVPAITNAESYMWAYTGTGVIINEASNNITADFASDATSGNLTVKGVNSCGNGTFSTLAITINAKPATPTISLIGETLHSEALSGNQWFNQNGLISGATDQNYTVTDNGDYYVIVTLTGCRSDASNIININLSGVETINDKSLIKVYPNPFSNELTIEIKENHEELNFEILNTIGQIVFKGNFIEKTTVRTSNYAPGVYFVKLENGKTFVFKKIIKE